MGRVLRREHEDKRLAFAALLTTGMIAALLAFAALAAPSPAYAAQLQGKGTADEPTLIYSTDDLIAWCNSLNGMSKDQERQQYARLMNDLTAPGPDGAEYGGVVDDAVVDKMNHPDLQVAKLDGNGHLIELQLTSHSALFQTGGKAGDTGVTTIKDLHVIGSVSYSGNAGTLFGSIGTKDDSSDDRRIEIRDCTNQANVQGGPSAGGFIGSYFDNNNDKGSIVIERCSNFGEILSLEGHAGGMVGSLVKCSDKIPARPKASGLEYCSNNGGVKSMGGSFPTFYDNNNQGKPETIGGCAGGLVGYLSYIVTTFSIHHDYNQGEIYSSSSIGYSGGLVGFADTLDGYARSVSSCYNSGAIKTDAAEAGHAGGLFGYAVPSSFKITSCETLEGSVPADAIGGSACNGRIVSMITLDITHGYTNSDPEMCIGDGGRVLEGVGVGKDIKITLINPMNSERARDAYGYAYWNTVFSSKNADAPKGYSLAYWTLEAPDASGTWSKPPKEYKANPDDMHDRIYGGDPIFYAYCVPSSATVKFDLNKPAGYTCSMEPKDATKTFVKGEPVGALPTATCVNGKDENDTRAFLGWATMPDGNDSKAEWISESSDNLYDFVESGTVTLYAQWADTSLPFDITIQPEDFLASALAEVGDQRISFGFATLYPFDNCYRYSVQLQYREDSDDSYKEVTDLLHSDYRSRVYFLLESPKQAIGDYRLKIDYYELDNLMGTLYTSSANIVLQIPQSEANVTVVGLVKDDESSNNSETDEILGTRTYDVSGIIQGDIPLLIGDAPSPESNLIPNDYAYNVWIEGDDTVSEKKYVADTRYFNLADQHLKEGQTYQLCVARTFYRSYGKDTYEGESEPYRIPFVVPYADSVPVSITVPKMTVDDVVTLDNKPCSFETFSKISLNKPFNLVVDAKYEQPQPESRPVQVRWQYSDSWDGVNWADLPVDTRVAWSDDRKTARLYTTLNADIAFDEAIFRVRLSSPPSPDSVISNNSKELSVYLAEPEMAQPTVTDDTHVKLEWTWLDGGGSLMTSGGFAVSIERREPGGGDWVEEKTDWTTEYSYETTLDPQVEYRACVRAETAGLKSDYSNYRTFKTTGETGLAWDDAYCTAYLPSEKRNDKISVDYDWANYNDGKHAVQYSWYLNDNKDGKGGYSHFATTESDSMNFPEDFVTEKQWDPTKAWWVKVEARVWTLTDEGELGHVVTGTAKTSSPLPVVHNTTAPQNLKVKDVGSYHATVCWDAPAEGTVREYEVKAGSYKQIVPVEAGKTSYEATINLSPSTYYSASVSTVDFRKRNSTIATTPKTVEVHTLPSPEVGTWTVTADKTAADLGDKVTLSASYAANSGKFPTAAELQWYSWCEGEADWQPEGDPVTLDDASKDYTTTLIHEVTSEDYGRQWKLGVKATSPDASVTGSSNVVTVSIMPPAPTNVACGAPTPTSLPVSWKPVEDAEGYQIKCVKLDTDGNPENATTYSVTADSLKPDAGGKLCYEVLNLQPSTTYQVSVAAFVRGVTGEFSAAPDAKTLAEPTIETPVFQQVPKTAWVEAGDNATFTAQASVSDGGAISYAWQRKGAGEQDFTPIAQSDKYVMSENAGVATLTVKKVGADDVAAAFRCVATNSKDNQTANAASAAAYLTVAPVAPTDVQAQATSATTGEVTWEASGAIHRFAVTWRQFDGSGYKGSEYSKVVTIPNDKTQGSCQLEGLLPESSYEVAVYAAPEAGFRSEKVTASLYTPAASALDSATVSPDKTLVKPGETVTFKVETNVDGLLPERLEYRWQRNSSGEFWFDVEGEAGAKKELSVTAPEGGSVESYRCIVTSTRTTIGVGADTKGVTSSVGLLLTSVPVAPPVQLAAEPGTTLVHLTWASDDPRDVTYQVQYAEGPTPNDDAWQTVDNVGSSTSCDVEGLKANTVYSWRVQAVVRDQLWSEWAQADTFITLEEPSALATVSVTPRWGAAVAGSSKGVTYTAVTNIDNALNGETLSYQWQESATGVEWSDVQGATEATYVADTANKKPRSCQYRCVVTASKDGAPLKTITSESVNFRTTATPPTDLVAKSITAATADLSWEGSLVEGLSYRVFWRASGADAWTSTSDLTEAKYTLKSLMPATTYEWYVQVMDNGEPSARSVTSLFVTQSLSPIPQLTRVVVGPLDQTLSATEQAAFAAYTNVDDMPDATRAYKWEMRDLDSDVWKTLADKTTREIKLDPGADGYVRCTVTYTPPTSVLVPSLTNTSVTSTNEARVRIMPEAPSNPTVSDVTQTTAKVSWTGDASGVTFDLVYRAVGSSEWTSVPGLKSASTNLIGLNPGTMYEWNVRSVAYGASDDPLRSDWIAGPLFTTNPEDIVFSRAEVTPSATSIMAGADSTVTLTANTDADTGETLTYQWQRLVGDTWRKMEGATAATLQVSAKDLPVGEHAYRCEVTATRGGQEKTLVSNESVVTAMPAAPTDLSVDDFVLVDPNIPTGSVRTAFHWKWGGDAALPDGATFEVSYRKLAGDGSYLKGWTSEGLTIDNENRACEAVLEAPKITYQWRVRVVQDGATSPWSLVDTFITKVEEPAETLSSVLVTPTDSLVSNDKEATVTLTASTNVKNESKLAYKWEWCPLTTVDPRIGGTWTEMADETSKEITLSGDERNRYVRCTVTQPADGADKPKIAISNPACVRTEPVAPYGTYASMGAGGGINLGWECGDVRAQNDAQKNVIGYEVNYRKIGTSEWAEEICNTKNCGLASRILEPNATYEWRVRTILSSDMGGDGGLNPTVEKGGPHSEWVDGPVFTAPKVEVTPTRAAAVIGNGRTLTFTAMPNDIIMNDAHDETYQWQRYNGKSWVDVLGATSEKLTIVANEAVTAGTSRYRCVVKAGDYRNATSNEVTCTLAPAAPANLTASNITSGEAKLTWTWEKGGLQAADEFEVLYRESGAKVWETATAADGAYEFVLKDLKPETIYEWRVRAVQNGVESLPSSSNLFVTASEHPALKLESVLVEPANLEVAQGAEATVTATTNLDGMVGAGELTYVWEKRALDSNPNDSDAWKVIEGQESSSVTLPAKTSGFVRCKVTYTVDGSQPVVSNEVSVRVQPASAPTNLKVKDIGNTAATFVWDGTVPDGGSFTLLYRTAGTETWTTVPKLAASPYTAQDLAPGTTYEWRMCSVSADGLISEWVDGSKFTTTSPDAALGEVKVAPERAEAVAGDSALVEDFFATVTGAAEGQSLAYQWQALRSGTWTNLPGETGERTHLSVANLEAGEYSLRCVVTATAPGGKSKTVESNKATLALSLATPSDLDAQRVTRGAATLTWTWAGPGAVDSFNVRYREEGASDAAWVNVPADSVDPASMTCIIKGLAHGTSYEWQVQAVRGDQTSSWVASGFVTLSDGPLKVARIWPSDVTVAKDEQARFVVFTNRGDAEDVSYEWQRRGLYSEDAEGSWEAIPNATGRVLTLDANTAGYVRCVATQAAPAAQATEVVEAPGAVEAPQAVASNETLEANEAPDANETNETNEASETPAAPVTPVTSEVAETPAAPTPASVAISNQARVRVEPGVPNGLAVGTAGFTNAALSWAAADVDGVVFTLAYRVAGSPDWTEVPGLTAPAYELGGLVQGTSYEWRVQAVVGTGDDALKSAWAYGDSFTTQTMRTYQVMAGADGTWKPGQPSLSFTIDAPRDKFLSLAVDGVELVQGTDYTVVEGSTVVTLSSDYLASLKVGKHELVATFSDGTASTAFTVAAAEPTPSDPSGPPTPGDQPASPTPLPSAGGKALAPTGDPLGAALPLVGVLAMASACIAVAAFARKRWCVLKRDRHV